MNYPTGAIIDPDVKEKFWDTLPFENIMSANPALLTADDGADIFFFDAEAAYLKEFPGPWDVTSFEANGIQGKYLLNHKQERNDCTSHATSGALEDEQMIAIMWRNEVGEFFPIASEPLYGGAIVTMMKRKGDNGAYTNAPLDYATKYGFLARAKYEDYDLTNYNPQLVLSFCKTGVPSTLLEQQSRHKLLTVVPVHSFEEGSAFMRQGYTVLGGSRQGFTLTRDIDGFCKPKGTWAHCTRMRGRRGGSKPGWAYGQSWGASVPNGRSNVLLDSGRNLALPEGTFFVDPDTVNTMIKEGEFYAVSRLTEFALLDYKLY